jgi:hypothetical protein
MGEPIAEGWVTAYAAGKSFAEVGGLWGTVNEQVTVAARAGATSTTMIDVIDPERDLWTLFRDRAASFGVTDTTCIQANIDDRETPLRVGAYDVVFCSGILYHCAAPLHTLRQLHSITRERLILGTASIPETVTNSAGTVSVETGAALLIPALSQSQLAVLGQWLHDVGAQAVGVNHPLAGEWNPKDYEPWWWFFTRDHVAGLLRVAGFTVEAVASYWEGRATLFLARTGDVTD